MKKVYICLIIGLGLIMKFNSYSQVSIDAEIRPRTELRSGFNQPLADSLNAGFATLQRTRLNLNYSEGILKSRISLQDARIFGETNPKQPSSATSGSIGIYEAWAEIQVLTGVSVKIGRQEINFEDGRLFSRSSWSNTGNSHDLMQLVYRSNSVNGEVGLAYNNQHIYNADSSYYNVSKSYKKLAFVHFEKSLSSGLSMTLLGVSEGFNRSAIDLDLYYRYTLGGTLKYKKNTRPFDVFITGYYQTGKSSAFVDLNAFLLALKANYNLSTNVKFIAGVDYLSGSESNLDASKNNTFNKLNYCANHSFYGYMEYWSRLPKGGLTNYYIGAGIKFSRQLSSELTWHQFCLNKPTKLSTTELEGSIGSEFDFVLNYKVSESVGLQFAWCTYICNENTLLMKFETTNVDFKFPQYAYLMFSFTPKF